MLTKRSHKILLRRSFCLCSAVFLPWRWCDQSSVSGEFVGKFTGNFGDMMICFCVWIILGLELIFLFNEITCWFFDNCIVFSHHVLRYFLAWHFRSSGFPPNDTLSGISWSQNWTWFFKKTRTENVVELHKLQPKTASCCFALLAASK